MTKKQLYVAPECELELVFALETAFMQDSVTPTKLNPVEDNQDDLEWDD